MEMVAKDVEKKQRELEELERQKDDGSQDPQVKPNECAVMGALTLTVNPPIKVLFTSHALINSELV